jgi:multidrug efflux pump subunit AcrA (membrane-fusion protein)
MLRGLGTALVGSVLVLTIVGVALGTLLGECDLLNPATSAAQARSMDTQTQIDRAEAQLETEQRQAEIAAQQAVDTLDLEHQAAMYEHAEKRGEADLEHYETALAMERASLERQHELQLQHQQQAFEREMAMKEVRQIVFLGIGSGAMLAITIAVVYYLYACGQVKLSQAARAERDHHTAKPEGKHHARRPASGILRRPMIADGRPARASSQDPQGGNGRGPHVRLHDPECRTHGSDGGHETDNLAP